MHALVINQFFWPDVAPTGALLTDVVRSLGSKVTAICGHPGYANGAPRTAAPPARIIQSQHLPFARGPLARLASYASFFGGALWNASRIPDPELVLTLTTPPLTGLIGTFVKSSKRKPRHIIWQMDLYPDIAVDLGVLKANSPITRSIAAISRWSDLRADAIIALGDDMKARLLTRGIPADKIHVAENWADGQEITPQAFPARPLTVHYSGNLGLAHDTDTIAGAIRHLTSDDGVRFVFAGGGPQRGKIPAAANVEMRGYSPQAELSASLGEGHLGLVTQLPQTCGSIVPSKTYGIMAAGRPILYIGPRAATPARIIERYGCGWQVDPGDVRGVVELLGGLRGNGERLREAGGNARRAFERNYDKPIGVGRILRIIDLVMAGSGVAETTPWRS